MVSDCLLEDLLCAVHCEIACLPFTPHICLVYSFN